MTFGTFGVTHRHDGEGWIVELTVDGTVVLELCVEDAFKLGDYFTEEARLAAQEIEADYDRTKAK